VEITDNRLPVAKYCWSPNHDDRPPGSAIDTVVIHNISLPPGEFGGNHIEALFSNTLNPVVHPYFAEICHLQVSAHVLIDRQGECIQFVPFNKRAWHAGESSHRGRKRFNDFSIGIELEGSDHVPYTNVQYEQLACLVRALMSCYPEIVCENIVGHEHISPGRKTDPGPAFNWPRFHGLLG